MINIIYREPFSLGIILLLGISLFYCLRFIRPEISKDSDFVFTTITVIYSGIIIEHGWRLDALLFFSQILIIICVLCIGWENIRLRGLLAQLITRELGRHNGLSSKIRKKFF
uniref:Ycf66 n=1 Tax=Haramonas pauciplastida TaxID=478668 RepID=UPI0021149C0E|nr:Ycf66 [Haramonas pauciplastida]YP_010444192.1 Ycf66 [Haramonas pauciplastida]UTE95020.1 Ycf66 [Haramonas pauciplastida]UTE95078.1 Ycf66 [Haramonas pauciplastida]